MRQLRLAIAVVCFACATGREAADPEIDPKLPEAMRACLERPAVHGYFEDVHDRMVEAWVVPAGTPVGRKVRVRMRITESGELAFAEVLPSSDEDFSASVLRAVNASIPFPPVPADALCLTSLNLRFAFEAEAQD